MQALGGSGPSHPPSSQRAHGQRQHRSRKEESGGVWALREALHEASWVRTGLPRPLASTAVSPLRSSHSVTSRWTNSHFLSCHQPPLTALPPRGAPPEVSTEAPGQFSPGSTYQSLSSQASTPVSVRLSQRPEKLSTGELRVWKYYPSLQGHDENPHIQIMPQMSAGLSSVSVQSPSPTPSLPSFWNSWLLL